MLAHSKKICMFKNCTRHVYFTEKPQLPISSVDNVFLLKQTIFNYKMLIKNNTNLQNAYNNNIRLKIVTFFLDCQWLCNSQFFLEMRLTLYSHKVHHPRDSEVGNLHPTSGGNTSSRDKQIYKFRIKSTRSTLSA